MYGHVFVFCVATAATSRVTAGITCASPGLTLADLMEDKKKSRLSCFGRSSNKHGKTCSDLQLIFPFVPILHWMWELSGAQTVCISLNKAQPSVAWNPSCMQTFLLVEVHV